MESSTFDNRFFCTHKKKQHGERERKKTLKLFMALVNQKYIQRFYVQINFLFKILRWFWVCFFFLRQVISLKCRKHPSQNNDECFGLSLKILFCESYAKIVNENVQNYGAKWKRLHLLLPHLFSFSLMILSTRKMVAKNVLFFSRFWTTDLNWIDIERFDAYPYVDLPHGRGDTIMASACCDDFALCRWFFSPLWYVGLLLLLDNSYIPRFVRIFFSSSVGSGFVVHFFRYSKFFFCCFLSVIFPYFRFGVCFVCNMRIYLS